LMERHDLDRDIPFDRNRDTVYVIDTDTQIDRDIST